jgi:hypothetical protein
LKLNDVAAVQHHQYFLHNSLNRAIAIVDDVDAIESLVHRLAAGCR